VPADFSGSTVTANTAAVHPLGTIGYTIAIRNSGDAAPQWVQVAQPMPVSALYVSSSSNWKFDPARRRMEWFGRIPPGRTETFGLTLIAKPESEGSLIANRTEVLYESSTWNTFHSVEVGTAPNERAGIDIGNVRVDGLSVAVTLAFLAIIVFAIIGSRKSRALAMLVIGFGFMAIFASLGWKDYRTMTRYTAAECTVLDALAPYAAVRYGNTLSVTRGDEDDVNIGETVPCWFDPEDAKQVVLSRSVSPAYIFALPALLAIVIGVGMLRTPTE
jgi:uncharacterized repeat protein (TIGR01451 family)